MLILTMIKTEDKKNQTTYIKNKKISFIDKKNN